MLPNFLIIGAQRSGTTTLHRILGRHCDVFTTPVKEIYYFVDANYYKGINWYEKQFSNWNGEAAIGESSPDYMISERAAQRIKKSLTDVKLLMIVRNPVERVYSAYWNNRLNLVAPYTRFEAAIQRDPLHLERGFYYRHIQRFLKVFEKEDLLVLLYDDLKDYPTSLFKKCFSFLGVDDSYEDLEFDQVFNRGRAHGGKLYQFALQNSHLLRYLPKGTGLRRILKLGKPVSFEYPAMDQGIKQRLISLYEDSNLRLSEFLGRDISHWNANHIYPQILDSPESEALIF